MVRKYRQEEAVLLRAHSFINRVTGFSQVVLDAQGCEVQVMGKTLLLFLHCSFLLVFHSKEEQVGTDLITCS